MATHTSSYGEEENHRTDDYQEPFGNNKRQLRSAKVANNFAPRSRAFGQPINAQHQNIGQAIKGAGLQPKQPAKPAHEKNPKGGGDENAVPVPQFGKPQFQIYCDEEFMDCEPARPNQSQPEAVPAQRQSDRYSLGDTDDSLVLLDQISAHKRNNQHSPAELVSLQNVSDPLNKTFDGLLSVHNFPNYNDDILVYLLRFEQEYLCQPSCIERQPEVNFKMRSILVDWMVEVCDEYKFHSETLFLAASMIDRFLSMHSIERQTFQLLGTTALFVASKYEEIYPPDIMEFVYITDDSYTKYQILNMEKCLLHSLKFSLSGPTSHYFAQKFLAIFDLPNYIKSMTNYIVHLALISGDLFMGYLPSEIAISALLIAVNTFSMPHLVPTDYVQMLTNAQATASSISAEEIRTRRRVCLTNLAKTMASAKDSPHQSIRTKFSDNLKYQGVARIEAIKTGLEGDYF